MDTLTKESIEKLVAIKPPWQLSNIQIDYHSKRIFLTIDYLSKSKFPCSQCGKICKVHDSNDREWRHLDLFEYACYLRIKTPRTICSEHGVRVIKNHPFGRMESHFSFKFEDMLIPLFKEMSVNAIAAKYNETDQKLWRVFDYYIPKAVAMETDCSKTNIVGVDETAIKRGHNYVSIFSDLQQSRVIYVTPGKDSSVFAQFYENLFKHMGDPNYIKQFSMDMSTGFKKGREEYFSGSKVVFDRFHIKQALLESIDKVRKQEVINNEKLKKTKYIWLKNACNLKEKEKQKLNEFLLDCSTKTAQAYQLKISFDQLWKVQPLAIADMLSTWIKQATALNLEPINQFINTVKNNWKGIISSMTSSVTNAFAEGLNSIVQLARSRARGFKNINRFINMIYFLGNDFKFNFH